MNKIILFCLSFLSLISLMGCSQNKNQIIELDNDNIYKYLDWSFVTYKNPTPINNFYNIKYEGFVGPQSNNIRFIDVEIRIETKTKNHFYTLNSKKNITFTENLQYSYTWMPINYEFPVSVHIVSGKVEVIPE